MDPWGHKITDAFGAQLREGLDVRPTIAITKVSAPCPDAPRTRRGPISTG